MAPRIASLASALAFAWFAFMAPCEASQRAGEDAAHPGYAHEWWRVTSRLRASDGRDFAFVSTFFRMSLGGTSGDAFESVATLTDLGSGTRAVWHRAGRDALGDAASPSDRLSVRVADWSVRTDASRSAFRTPSFGVHVDDGDSSVSLALAAKRPRVVFSAYRYFREAGTTHDPHFAAYTRLASSGTIVTGGHPVAVTGMSWMDHVYGDAGISAGTAWNLFELRLLDGRDAMIFISRDRDGTNRSIVNLLAANGSIRVVRPRPVERSAKPNPYTWRSPRTSAVYPDISRFIYPSEGLDFTAAASTPDQEVVEHGFGPWYWDGAVDAADFESGGTPIGSGFAQHMGYDAPS